MDAAMMSPKASKAQQEYVADTERRFSPSFWTVVALVLFLASVAVWILLH